MEDYSVDNHKGTVKQDTKLQSQFNRLAESKTRLRSALERLERLEVKISGDRISDLKKNNDKGEDVNPMKDCIINNFDDLNYSLHTIINEIYDSINHLEELI